MRDAAEAGDADLIVMAKRGQRGVLDALRAQVREIMGKSANPLSDVLLRWSPSGWVPLQ